MTKQSSELPHLSPEVRAVARDAFLDAGQVWDLVIDNSFRAVPELTAPAADNEVLHADYHDDQHSDSHEDRHTDSEGERHGDTHSDFHSDRHNDTHSDSK